MSSLPVTLQVSVAPSDHRLVGTMLEHQARFWRGAVAEILITIDTHRSRGRFGADWEAGRDRVLAAAAGIGGAVVREVDYRPAARAAVSAAFFGGRAVPAKDCRGGPYYSYFFGLQSAAHDHVLHADADMFFGGDGRAWLEQALTLYADDPTLLFTAPLPGAPAADGRLRQLAGEPVRGPTAAWQFREMSTRVFLFDRQRFRARIGALRPRRPGARECFRALLDGQPWQELPEVLFTDAMEKAGLRRVDFLGRPGCWTIHPPYRSADFFARLPEIARRIEANDLPPGQLGDHDLNDTMVDWTEPRERLKSRRWWRRLGARLRGGNA